MRAAAIGACVAIAATCAVYATQPLWAPDPGVASAPSAGPTTRQPTAPAPGAPGTTSPGAGAASTGPDGVRLSDDVRARVLAAVRGPVVLDPGSLERRTVQRAALVVASSPTIALDADTGTWVRLVLPADVRLENVRLSPDGTRLLRTYPRLESIPLAGGTPTRIELDAGLPAGPDTDCLVQDAAWSRDGARIAATFGCLTFGSRRELAEAHTHVLREASLTDGRARTVERVDGYPSESYPSYSPDDAHVVTGFSSSDQPYAVRTVATDGTAPFTWDDTHVVYGDPWRDARTVLVWDEAVAPTEPGAHALLDVVTGTKTPLPVAGLANLLGYVGGRLTVRGPLTAGCDVDACFVDPASGAIDPWLDLPGGDEGAPVVLAAWGLIRSATG